MKYLIGFIVVLIMIVSCRKPEVSYKSMAQYQARLDKNKSSVAKVNVLISYDTLFKWLKTGEGQVLFDSKNENSNLPLQITQAGKITIHPISKDQIEITLPVSWIAEPNLSGFSAGKVTGKMHLKIKTKLDISDFKKLKCNQLDFEYDWMERPSVKVMGFGVNVTGLIDQLIKNQKSSILTSLSNYTNRILQFNYWEYRLKKELKPIVFQDFVFHHYQTKIDLDRIAFQSEGISGLLKIQSIVELSDKYNVRAYDENANFEFGRISNDSTSKLSFNVNLSYTYLENIFTESLRSELKQNDVKLTFLKADSSHISFELKSFKGVQSRLTLDLIPVIYSDEQLGIKVNDLSFKQLPFSSSLFKRTAQKRITYQLNAYRFNLNERIKELFANNELIQSKNDQLILEDIQWNGQAVNLRGFIQGEHSLKK